MERGLSMVDGVLPLVDAPISIAADAASALRKALAAHLPVISGGQ